MLRPSLAKDIMTEVKNYIDEDLIVVDTNGIIIASTDQERVGTFHEGAMICIQERSQIIISEGNQATLQGVKAGINLPVFFQQQIVGVIGITGNPSKVEPFGEIIRKMTELLVKESYYSEQLEWQARSREAFVFDWIQQKEWSSKFQQQAELLGINLEIDRQVVLGQLASQDQSLIHQSIWQDILHSYLIGKEDVMVRWGRERFVILHASRSNKPKEVLYEVERLKRHLTEKFKVNVSFGIGQQVLPFNVTLSYQQAERALAVATRNHSIIFDEDLRLEMCLQEIKKETRAEYLSRTVAPMIAETELIDTLRTFITQNQSFKKTAETLNVHINTLHYRLKRIEQLTSLNPRNFHELTTLYLGLLFLDDELKIK